MCCNNSIEVKLKMEEGGVIPVFKREGDACCDCYSRSSLELAPGRRGLVGLGFRMELPDGYEAVVRPRSGNSSCGTDIAIGTIDGNYRGEVMACVINGSDHIVRVEKGDRICQMAVRRAPEVVFRVVGSLSETDRGEAGFGSSGKK